MSTDNARVIKQLTIGADNTIYIRFRGSSNLVEAKALEIDLDEQGEVKYLLLDRIIHRPAEQRYECNIDDTWKKGFNIAGCFVTELTRPESLQ